MAKFRQIWSYWLLAKDFLVGHRQVHSYRSNKKPIMWAHMSILLNYNHAQNYSNSIFFVCSKERAASDDLWETRRRRCLKDHLQFRLFVIHHFFFALDVVTRIRRTGEVRAMLSKFKIRFMISFSPSLSLRLCLSQFTSEQKEVVKEDEFYL